MTMTSSSSLLTRLRLSLVFTRLGHSTKFNSMAWVGYVDGTAKAGGVTATSPSSLHGPAKWTRVCVLNFDYYIMFEKKGHFYSKTVVP